MTRLLFLAALFLAACSGPDIRIAPVELAPAAVPSDRVSIAYRSVEVGAATLPSYATSEEIFAQKDDGTLLPLGPLWSDDPARALILQVARDLGTVTGRLVAPDPWPFREFADVKVDIRVADFYVTAGNAFRLAGQYFVAPDSGRRNRARSFAIEIPIVEEGAPALIAAARDAAVRQLAIEIARDGLR